MQIDLPRCMLSVQQYSTVMTIQHLDSSYFDWLTWCRGSLLEMFNIQHRELCILNARETIKKHAIGYCPAEKIPCRPKKDYVAIMFLFNNDTFWTHITNREFELIFKE